MPSWNKLIPPLRKFFVPQKPVTPVIAMGLGSADRGLPQEFRDVKAVSIRELILHHLGGDKEAIAKMSPREIKKLADTVWKEAKATGIIFPGSTNTIAEIFQDENAEIPTALDVPTANSIFKMDLTVKALSEETPSLYSCDGFNYPTTALKGKVTKSLEGGLVEHDGMSSHNIKVKKGSWLGKETAKITKRRDGSGNPIIFNTPSTHPLVPTKIPDEAEILATAPDGSPCIVAFNDNAIGVLDHPEAGTIKKDKRKKDYSELGIFAEDFSNDKEVNQDDEQINKLFWKIIRNKFIADASVENNAPTKPNTKISPRISEILDSPDIKTLSATRVSMATRAKVK